MPNAPQLAPKAYSYTRFSTPEQAKGDSARRQIAAAEAWAVKRNMELDDRLRLSDAGVSAYRGKNAAEGALKGFLEHCEHGLVAPGSYLLIESLDRLSRQDPWDTVALMRPIINSGVTIVTLSDGQEYDRQGMADGIQLIIAITVAIRSHDESRTKGKRVAAAWAEKRRKVRAGESARLTKRAPAWLSATDDGWAVDEERAAIVRRVFDETLAGRGEHSIAERLNEEGVAPFGRAAMWHRSSVSKLLGNTAVIGELTPGRITHDDNVRRRVTEDPIPGAYPAIIDEETFRRVRALKDGLSTSVKGRGAAHPLANMLSGLARCPKCGSAMTRVSKGSGSKAGQPYLVCTKAKAGAGCVYRTVKLPAVEDALVAKARELLADIPAGRTRAECDDEIATLDSEIAGAEEKLWQLSDALSSSPSAAGAALMAETEADIRRLQEARADSAEARRLLDGGLIDARSRALDEATAAYAQDPDAPREPITGALRVLFSNIVVDYEAGRLVFEWKHGGTSTLNFGLPSPA